MRSRRSTKCLEGGSFWERAKQRPLSLCRKRWSRAGVEVSDLKVQVNQEKAPRVELEGRLA